LQQISYLRNLPVPCGEVFLSHFCCTKKHPIADRKLKTVTAEHLQAFLDLLTFGGEFPDGKVRKGLQQRLYPFFFRSVAAVIPFCSISKTVNHFQSDAVY